MHDKRQKSNKKITSPLICISIPGSFDSIAPQTKILKYREHNIANKDLDEIPLKRTDLEKRVNINTRKILS